jgi:quinohemoprotein ethanol dehydrogenase
MTRVQQQAAAGRDWLLNGRTFNEDRFSPLTQIDAANVDRLGLAWEFNDIVVRGRTHHGMEANPIEVDGVLYFSGPWGVAYAVDARTGKSLWTYDPRADGQYGRYACCDVVNRGLTVWKGKVYIGSLDGWLNALDAKTGKPVWRVDTFIEPKRNYTIVSAPRIAGDKILIGNAGADMGARGYVSAYDAESGELRWRFYAVPGDGPDETPDVTFARKTWAKDTRWQFGRGGNPWNGMAYDPELGLAYIGFGNARPDPIALRSASGGDNLFAASIVALDINTGRMKWYYQTTPGDNWDYDATSDLVLADIPFEGKVHKVIMQAPKNGIFYVLDRATGELLRADPYTTVTWTTGVDLKSGRPRISSDADYTKKPQIIWPGGAGGHSWQPMSYDPQTGLVYFPVDDLPMKFSVDLLTDVSPGGTSQQFDVELPPFTQPGDSTLLRGRPTPSFDAHLKAWNPLTGTATWVSAPLPFVSGGVLTTTSGLLFEGSTDGVLSVYEARTGKVLKRIETGTEISAAPIAYELNGTEYIAVTAGAGGPENAAFAPNLAAGIYQNAERLLVFKLDGGPIPLPPKVVVPEPQPTPEAIRSDPATLARGEQAFTLYCARCHAVGGAFGAYPNLWNLPAGTLAGFEDIVYGGALRYAGMGNFSDLLSLEDVRAIKAFIITDEIAKRRQGENAGAHYQGVTH